VRVALPTERGRETLFGSTRLRLGPGPGPAGSPRRGCAGRPYRRLVLFAKVVLALMLGRAADGYLDIQRAAHLKRMRELTELKQQGTLIDTLLADHGLYHLEADLRWIDHTAARLDLLAEAVRR